MRDNGVGPSGTESPVGVREDYRKTFHYIAEDGVWITEAIGPTKRRRSPVDMEERPRNVHRGEP